MRRFACTTLALSLILGGSTVAEAQTAQPHDEHGGGAIHTPEKIEWRDGPPSLPEGAQFAIIEGDPSAKGEYFAMRLRLPDGYRIPAHWHPVHERVTIVSGIFHLGQGESFTEEGMEPLPAGSYFTMPPGMRHFARAEGETIIQLNSVGAWEIRYVNPAEDPRKKSGAR